MAIEVRTLTDHRCEFSIEINSFQSGLTLLPSPPPTPKAHRVQGGLIRSDMIDVAGNVLTPGRFSGRRIRVWLDQLERWHFSRRRLPNIGELYDRSGELPGRGLEAMIYIPKDAWLPATQCLGTTWRYLSITGVNGDGRRMTVVDFSFSAFPGG